MGSQRGSDRSADHPGRDRCRIRWRGFRPCAHFLSAEWNNEILLARLQFLAGLKTGMTGTAGPHERHYGLPSRRWRVSSRSAAGTAAHTANRTGQTILMEWTQPHYLKRPLKGPGW